MKQYVVAWLALTLYFWLFTKQIYGFFIGFQRMVANSSVEMNAADSIEHEIIFVQAAVFFIAAITIYLQLRETESKVFYYSYLFTVIGVVHLIHAYLIYSFN